MTFSRRSLLEQFNLDINLKQIFPTTVFLPFSNLIFKSYEYKCFFVIDPVALQLFPENIFQNNFELTPYNDKFLRKMLNIFHYYKLLEQKITKNS